MTRSNDERQPLLADEGNGHSEAPHHARHHAHSLRHRLSHFWPIIRVLVFAAMFGTCFYASQPSLLDEMRAFTCAFHYQRHPDLLPSDPHAPLPPDSRRPCAVPGVESKVGIVNAIQTFAQFGISSISMLFYGPKLSTWGRKPLLLLATFSALFGLLPYILLPLGYPYGPQPDQNPVSPTAAMLILLTTTCMQGLMGDAPMIYLVMNALAVDASKPETRSIYLSWILTATLVGAFFGPPLAAWALERSKHAKMLAGSSIATVLGRWVEHPRSGAGHGVGSGGGSPAPSQPPSNQEPVPLPPVPPAPPGAPPSPPMVSAHGNTAALKVVVVGYFLALLWTAFVLGETLKRAPEQKGVDRRNAEHDDTASAGAHEPGAGSEVSPSPPSAPIESSENAAVTKLRGRLGPLSIYLPVTLETGKRDYRITKMGIVVMLSSFGTMGLTYIALFSSYRFDWGPEKVGFVIAAIGGTRAAFLLLGVPAINKALERVVPGRVERRTGDEVGSADGDESSEDEGEGEGIMTSRGLPRRASIDIYLAIISYSIEWLGYVVVIFGATYANVIAMLIGTLSMSLGAAANPAVNSAAISIVTSRRLARSEGEAATTTTVDTQAKQTSDGWISASSITDTFFKFFSPLCYSLIYSLTIDSTTLAAACFFIPLASYGIAIVLLLSIV